MGKKMNKWLMKQDRLRLAIGWGKPDKKADQPPPAIKVVGLEGPMVIPNLGQGHLNFANQCLAGFIPKPTSDPAKPLNNGWSYGNWLEKRGFKLLGRGSYSRVYAKDGSEKVIKVTAGAQDDWIDYIQWAAKKGYCGTFAPRVYSWKKLYGRDGTVYSVSVVERMHCTLSEDKAGDIRLVESLMYPAIGKKNLMAQVYMDDLIPGSVAFLSDLTSSFSSNDIYGKNMMLRKDGSFCVTDPVCGQSTTTINRLRSRDFTSLGLSLRIYNASSLRFRERHNDRQLYNSSR